MASEKGLAENEKRELKRLGFVRIAAIQALVCVSNLYDYAKQSSGPLRSTVGKVENAVAAAVGPVYDKLKPYPDHLLFFLDRKVDEATTKFDHEAPPLAKQVISRAHSLAVAAADKAQRFVNEARTVGPSAAFHYAAEESKQLVVEQTANLWLILNRYPYVHPLAEKAGPTIALCSKKYNVVLQSLKEKGFIIIRYLPLIPVDEIAKAIEQSEVEKTEDSTESPENNKPSGIDSEDESPATPENKSPESSPHKSESESDSD